MKLVALYRALDDGGDIVTRWQGLSSTIVVCAGAERIIHLRDFNRILEEASLRATTAELRAILSGLGVVQGEHGALRVSASAASRVADALALITDCNDDSVSRPWDVVATIPESMIPRGAALNTLGTAGVVLSIIERAQQELWIAAPFMDEPVIRFLGDPLGSFVGRGGDLYLLTSTRSLRPVRNFLSAIGVKSDLNIHARILRSEDSAIGSHAKVVVADRVMAYIGSSNLTTPGFAHHLEIGVRLSGVAVGVLTDVLRTAFSVGEQVHAW